MTSLNLSFDNTLARGAENSRISLIVEDFDLFIDDEDEDNNLLEDNVDEIELLSFLNEYYLIYPEKVPQKDLY